MDGEACVFGVDDVTAFEEGEMVTPDPRQVLKVKGKIVGTKLKHLYVLFINHIFLDVDDCLHSPCVNGDCVDLQNGYQCNCEEGWTGQNCDGKNIYGFSTGKKGVVS